MKLKQKQKRRVRLEAKFLEEKALELKLGAAMQRLPLTHTLEIILVDREFKHIFSRVCTHACTIKA